VIGKPNGTHKIIQLTNENNRLSGILDCEIFCRTPFVCGVGIIALYVVQQLVFSLVRLCVEFLEFFDESIGEVCQFELFLLEMVFPRNENNFCFKAESHLSNFGALTKCTLSAQVNFCPGYALQTMVSIFVYYRFKEGAIGDLGLYF
jgi:hypothetical protein